MLQRSLIAAGEAIASDLKLGHLSVLLLTPSVCEDGYLPLLVLAS